MGGVLCELAGSGGGLGTFSVTVGTDSFSDPKIGINVVMYGYATAANTFSGAPIGAVSPSTLLGATINAIIESDDIFAGTGVFKLILDGDQTALSISQATVNGNTYTFSGGSFSGGQTGWTSGTHGVGNPFGGSPADVSFS